MERDRLHRAPVRQGIGCSVHYIPLHLHPYWRDRYACSRRLPAQPARLRAHGEPAAVHPHDDADVQRVVAPCGARRAGRLKRLAPMAKRLFDLVGATVALLCWRPLLLAGGRCDQARLARPGVLPPGAGRAPGGCFASTSSAPWWPTRPGPAAHGGRDPRITRVGRLAAAHAAGRTAAAHRRAAGHMSLVGPRPEVPRYVAHYPPALRDRALAVRPGITDPASLAFIDEAPAGARRRPRARVHRTILPRKLQPPRPTTPSAPRCGPTCRC
jgi:hypothetical protein